MAFPPPDDNHQSSLPGQDYPATRCLAKRGTSAHSSARSMRMQICWCLPLALVALAVPGAGHCHENKPTGQSVRKHAAAYPHRDRLFSSCTCYNRLFRPRRVARLTRARAIVTAFRWFPACVYGRATLLEGPQRGGVEAPLLNGTLCGYVRLFKAASGRDTIGTSMSAVVLSLLLRAASGGAHHCVLPAESTSD